jgi:biopolymer transport protein ExbB/TolQ
MNDSDTPLPPARNLWMRAVQTLVLLIALYIAMWLLCILSVVQLFAVAINDHPNEQLRAFGRALGVYMEQIGAFGSFSSDELPFPFGDWPAQP